MFHFTIRDVLWLTVVVALGLGWWVDRWRLSQGNRYRDWQIAKLINHLRDFEGVTVKSSSEGIFVAETSWDDGQAYWYPIDPKSKYPPEELVEAIRPTGKKSVQPLGPLNSP